MMNSNISSRPRGAWWLGGREIGGSKPTSAMFCSEQDTLHSESTGKIHMKR